MDKDKDKVKVNFGNDVGQFLRQFNGQVGRVTGPVGASGETKLVNLVQGGLFLRADQMEVVE